MINIHHQKALSTYFHMLKFIFLNHISLSYEVVMNKTMKSLEQPKMHRFIEIVTT